MGYNFNQSIYIKILKLAVDGVHSPR